MSEKANLAAVAEAIFTARETRKPIPPINTLIDGADAVSAYAIQEANTKRWLAKGRRAVGRKIGLTSKAVQQQLGVDQPDYGVLWADGEVTEGEEVPANKFMQPRIEAELAFVLKSDLNIHDLVLSDVVSAVDLVYPAVEIVDSAIADWKIKLADTIADNASAGGYMLGASPKPIGAVDLRLCGMVMTRDGEMVSSGVGAACLGNPLNATLWLARTMVRLGNPLRAGEVVLSGALGPMISARHGDRFTVEIQGFSPFSIGFA
jgi:2-keto-4-pentenoate hydratase